MTASDPLPTTTMPRLLVYQLTPIYAIQVFLRMNTNAFGNRPRLFRGWGPLSIRPLLVAATDKRIVSFQDVLSVSSVRIPVHKLASVCGKIISLTNCVGNVSRLMTRNRFAVITSA